MMRVSGMRKKRNRQLANPKGKLKQQLRTTLKISCR